MIKGLEITIVLSLLSHLAWSADEELKFAAKGAGRMDCADFVVSAEKKNTDYQLYAGWLEGFLTSYNQFQPHNYDITPWQTTELMLLLLERQCKEHPEQKYLDATNSLIKSLFPARLVKQDDIVQVSFGSYHGYFYQQTLLQAKQRLKNLGFYQQEVVADEFKQSDVKAFSSYQKKHGLKVTGFPDQRTLATLFLKKVKK